MTDKYVYNKRLIFRVTGLLVNYGVVFDTSDNFNYNRK